MIGRFRQPETEEMDLSKPRGFDDFEVRLGDVMRGERATMGKSLLDVQRELKIKATYIAAIENADPSAFETPGFIAGYVRSYARYLELDAEWAWKRFCAEGSFETAHGMSAAASSKRTEPRRQTVTGGDPFADSSLRFTPQREGVLARIEPSAIGSVAVLLGLIGLIGYGGFAVLNEVQKVQFVPVEQTPDVVADLDPLSAARAGQPQTDDTAGVSAGTMPDGFDRLYRPQALEVPVMVARDGPIVTLDPRRIGTLVAEGEMEGDGTALASAVPSSGPASPAEELSAPVLAAAVEPGGTSGEDGKIKVVADPVPEIVLFAVRPSWVRVRAADGTTLYEKIMQEGDRFVLPSTEEPATLRTGESGAIYFAVSGDTYGPAGRPGQITSNLALAADTLTEAYQVADLSRDTDLARVVVELQDLPAETPTAD